MLASAMAIAWWWGTFLRNWFCDCDFYEVCNIRSHHKALTAALDLPSQDSHYKLFHETFVGGNCWELQKDGRWRVWCLVCGGWRFGMVQCWVWLAHCNEQLSLSILQGWQPLWHGGNQAPIHRLSKGGDLEIYFERSAQPSTTTTCIVHSPRRKFMPVGGKVSVCWGVAEKPCFFLFVRWLEIFVSAQVWWWLESHVFVLCRVAAGQPCVLFLLCGGWKAKSLVVVSWVVAGTAMAWRWKISILSVGRSELLDNEARPASLGRLGGGFSYLWQSACSSCEQHGHGQGESLGGAQQNDSNWIPTPWNSIREQAAKAQCAWHLHRWLPMPKACQRSKSQEICSSGNKVSSQPGNKCERQAHTCIVQMHGGSL